MSKDTSPDTEQTVEIIQRYEGSLVGYSVDKGKTFHPSVKEAFDHLTTPISPTENTEELEFRAVDAEIDALMSEYGYTWDEPNMRYVNGDMEVSGDFASAMTIRMKKVEHQAVQAFGEKVLKEARDMFDTEKVRYSNIDPVFSQQAVPVSVITSLMKKEEK